MVWLVERLSRATPGRLRPVLILCWLLLGWLTARVHSLHVGQHAECLYVARSPYTSLRLALLPPSAHRVLTLDPVLDLRRVMPE